MSHVHKSREVGILDLRCASYVYVHMRAYMSTCVFSNLLRGDEVAWRTRKDESRGDVSMDNARKSRLG